MNKDELLHEMTRWFSPFEVDLRKVITCAKDQAKLSDQDLADLEKAIREPAEVSWKPFTLPPEPALDWTPRESDIQFIRDFIAGTKNVWEVESTDQYYIIDRASKTFTLAKDSERNYNQWHAKTKKILSMIGWKMVDNFDTTRATQGIFKNWVFNVFDFSIEEQINPGTGDLYPISSRDQDSVATCSGTVIRLGHKIGAQLWKDASSVATAIVGAPHSLLVLSLRLKIVELMDAKTEASDRDHGTGKTDAPGQSLYEL